MKTGMRTTGHSHRYRRYQAFDPTEEESPRELSPSGTPNVIYTEALVRPNVL
jgi:hypothetical protein